MAKVFITGSSDGLGLLAGRQLAAQAAGVEPARLAPSGAFSKSAQPSAAEERSASYAKRVISRP
jgi:hypothetical protein